MVDPNLTHVLYKLMLITRWRECVWLCFGCVKFIR